MAVMRNCLLLVLAFLFMASLSAGASFSYRDQPHFWPSNVLHNPVVADEPKWLNILRSANSALNKEGKDVSSQVNVSPIGLFSQLWKIAEQQEKREMKREMYY